MVSSLNLDRRVQFRRSEKVDDGLQRVEVFFDHGAPQWARRRDISDAERWRAGEVQASLVSRLVIRYSQFAADLTPKDRVLCEGVEYEITGIKEIERRRWLEVTLSTRIDR